VPWVGERMINEQNRRNNRSRSVSLVGMDQRN
jgi:hypothetical protein